MVVNIKVGEASAAEAALPADPVNPVLFTHTPGVGSQSLANLTVSVD